MRITSYDFTMLAALPPGIEGGLRRLKKYSNYRECPGKVEER